MKNPNCPCPNKECPVNGDCKNCKALHKKRKTYCQSGAAQKAFINFASNVNFIKNLYNAMVNKQLKKENRITQPNKFSLWG